MSTFSNDADLIVIEPNVFVDLPMIGQQLHAATDGAVAGAEVTSAAGGFGSLAAGHVLTVRHTPAVAASYAIASVDDDTTITLDTSATRFDGLSALVIGVYTFAPQAALVHDDLLRSIGINTDDAGETLDASAVVSTGLMRRLETLGTLARAYRAGAQLERESESVALRAEGYERRFARAVGAARVLIDTNGDGRADAWRVPAASRVVRV